MEWTKHLFYQSGALTPSLDIDVWDDGTIIINPDTGAGGWVIDINDLREVIEKYEIYEKLARKIGS